MAASNAERQKAFRERMKQRLAGMPAAPPLPEKPKISVPANKRWAALRDRMQADGETLRDEMQEYYDERSETWQEDDRGAEFQERIDAVERVLDALAELEELGNA